MVSSINSKIGEKIKAARRRAGLSIDAFCDRVGISLFRLAQIEKGRNAATADELFRIKTVLGLDLKTFYRGLQSELEEPDK